MTPVSRAEPVRPQSPSSGLGVAAILALAFFAYVMLIGGTAFGELIPWLHLFNGGVAGMLIVAYVRGLHRSDGVDRIVIAALALFVGAAVFSSFLRQSFDAALGALSYAAAFFVARDLLVRPKARHFLVYLLVGLSTVVTLTIASSWIPLALEWWSLMDWTVAPPLGFELQGGRWGHRHDAALLIAMLYPAWWLGRPSLPRKVGGVVIGIIALTVILLGGSRAVWLAMGVATLAIVAPLVVHHWPRGRRPNVMIVGAAALILATSMATGLAQTFLSRLLNLATVEYRTAMWTSLVEAWLTSPATGLGPGGFPWILQTTDYFQANTWAPRHPDSALFQLLPEAGLLGLAAILLLLGAFVPALLRAPSPGARWALIAFGVACLAANPSDFAFMVALAIAWMAYLLPRPQATGASDTLIGRRIRVASFGALTIVGVAYLSTVVAGFSYARAAEAVAGEDLASAEDHLSSAIAFDPGMALYWRQRGIARLLVDRSEAAIADLGHAAGMNPVDDVTWRGLSIAHRAGGDTDTALRASERALEFQPSDPSNVLLAARMRAETGDRALESLGQALQTWPALAVAPGWDSLIQRAGLETTEVLDRAAAEARAGTITPESDPPLLAAMTRRRDLAPSASAGGLGEVRFASYACSIGVPALLAEIPAAGRQSYAYWEIVIRESYRRDGPDHRAIRLFEILSSRTLDPVDLDRTLNPLHQHDHPAPWGSEIWGYRRIPLAWPSPGIELPSPRAGALRWLLAPAEAGSEVGLSGCDLSSG